MRTYFIDNEIYYQNKKQPSRKVEVFDMTLYKGVAYCRDEDGNAYKLEPNRIIYEED